MDEFEKMVKYNQSYKPLNIEFQTYYLICCQIDNFRILAFGNPIDLEFWQPYITILYNIYNNIFAIFFTYKSQVLEREKSKLCHKLMNEVDLCGHCRAEEAVLPAY